MVSLLLVLVGFLIQSTTALLAPVAPPKNKNILTSSRCTHTGKDTDIEDIPIERETGVFQQQQWPPIKSNKRRGLFHAASVTAMSVFCCASYGPKIALADDDNVEAKSPFIAFAKKFVRDDDNELISTKADNKVNPLDGIDWDGPKKRGLNLEQMADAINDGLVEREWFVTGQGKPELFSTNFAFTDPDVSLVGYEEYCRAVRRLFDQETARCELVCCSVTSPNTIVLLWRNSGRVNLGPLQVDLKPYLVTTTLKADPDDGNLIVEQVDEFESDPLGLVLYQVPLLRPLAGPPAPSVNVLKQQCDFYTCKLRVQ